MVGIQNDANETREGINMNWRKFGDELPKDNSLILICSVINTDPLYQPDKLTQILTGNYNKGLIDGSIHPDPEYDYWLYINEIPTPFE